MGPSSRSEDLIAGARAAVERDAKKWDEGAQWAAVELGAIGDSWLRSEINHWFGWTESPDREASDV